MPVFLPGESNGQRSLAGYSPWGHKEASMTEQLNTGADTSIQTINTYIIQASFIRRYLLSK